MITREEYLEILPHKDAILKFRQSGNYKGGDALFIADKLRQRYHIAPPINFGCDGCKVQAMNDLYNLMVEYEKNTN